MCLPSVTSLIRRWTSLWLYTLMYLLECDCVWMTAGFYWYFSVGRQITCCFKFSLTDANVHQLIRFFVLFIYLFICPARSAEWVTHIPGVTSIFLPPPHPIMPSLENPLTMGSFIHTSIIQTFTLFMLWSSTHRGNI